MQNSAHSHDEVLRNFSLVAAMGTLAKVASIYPQASSRKRNADERITSNGVGYINGSNNDSLEYSSLNETRSIRTTHGVNYKTGVSDSSEPQFIEPPSKKNPKKRKLTEEEKARRKPAGFHYDGATRRNMAPKIVYPRDRIIMNRLATRPWVREAKAAVANKLPTHFATNYLEMENEVGFSPRQPFWSFSPRVTPVETMPLKDRKRFFIYTPTSAMVKAMRDTVSELHGFFNPIENIGDCMLHPYPPPLNPDGGMRGTIMYTSRWEDDMGIHAVRVNYGVVALLVNSRLTNDQKEGWIEKSWHLSHLCGNWICCNWRHHTIEDGTTNVSRNGCFGSSKTCIHKPPCMKEKKQKLVLPAHKSKRTRFQMMDDDTDEEISERIFATGDECGHISKRKKPNAMFFEYLKKKHGYGKEIKKQYEEDEEDEVEVGDLSHRGIAATSSEN